MIRLKKEADEAVSMEALTAIVEQFELLTKEDYKTTVETACKDLHVNEATGHFYLKLANGTISNGAIPQPLVERILKSVELGIDPQPIIKFCIRAMRNPVFTDRKFIKLAKYVNYQSVDGVYRDELIQDEGLTVEVATERATFFQTPITQEGLLCTYKVSRELLEKFDRVSGEKKARYAAEYNEDDGSVESDGLPEDVEDRVFYPAVQGLNGGDEFTCEDILSGVGKKGHLIRVGCVHYLDTEAQINSNDDQACVKGLHVGNDDYIRGYEGSETVTHNVFIDPMDVRAITNDGSGALRVKRYFVHSSRAGKNRGIYHSSKYAAHTDAQWELMKAEAIANAEKLQEEVDKNVNQINSL